jgi:hypothetical protein
MHECTHKCYIWYLILQYKCMRAFIIMPYMLVVWYNCSAQPFAPKRKLSSAEFRRSWSGSGGVWKRRIRRWVSLGRRRGYEGWGGSRGGGGGGVGCKFGPLLDGTQNVDFHKEVSSILNDLFSTFTTSIKVFIYQLMHKRIALKGILKFTLKQLWHVSV